ncbi:MULTISPECIES: hypothetical protein [Streptomyces]|uniref:hypothetical protein n=1 Tax=Streptomyces TaxID=1883 RepID=UPI0022AB43DD|nr:hypothetical protein [Streptomyces sp. HB2AG]MCZ2524822.1 hypothetical protein [Streptomyces sp. HB2AG]
MAGRTKRTAARVAAAALAVVAVGGGVWYAGFHDDWREGRTLAEECDGLLPREELEPLLGASPLVAEEWSPREWGSGGPLGSCKVRAADEEVLAHLRVFVGWTGGARGLLTDLERHQPEHAGVVTTPVGSGWQGVLNAGAGVPGAQVVLDCGKEGDGAGRSLVVGVSAYPRPSEDLRGDEDRRAGLARLTARTAANAAEKWGCETKTGRDVEKVPAAPQGPAPAGRATGTCAGIDAPSIDVPADPDAPVEDCLLQDGENTEKSRFRLAAYYGPYAEDARDTTLRGDLYTAPAGGGDGTWWTTAACPQGRGTALFVVETIYGHEGFAEPAPALERKALERFASASAQRHGCDAPAAVTSGKD